MYRGKNAWLTYMNVPERDEYEMEVEVPEGEGE